MPKGECWRRQLSLDTGETWVLLPGGISRREVLKYDDYLREITHTHTHTTLQVALERDGRNRERVEDSRKRGDVRIVCTEIPKGIYML